MTGNSATAPDPPDPSEPRPRRSHGWLAAIALGVALLAFANELIALGSYHNAIQARRLILQGRDLEAMEALAAPACRLAPYSQEAGYARLVVLKNLRRWPDLADAAHRLGRWHPDASQAGLIEGEAAWHAGRAGQAAQALWLALWQAPAPPRSAAALWLTAAWASQTAWDDDDPHLATSVCQVLAHIEDAPVQRRRLMEEVRMLLDGASLPESAGAIASRLDSPGE